MDKYPEISISLKFYFNENIFDTITNKILLKPSKTWKKGEPRVKGAKLNFEDNGWQFKKKWNNSFSVEDCLTDFMKIILPKSEGIKRLVKCEEVEAEISIIIYIKNRNYPSIFFDVKTLNKLTSLGIDLDIDIM